MKHAPKFLALTAICFVAAACGNAPKNESQLFGIKIANGKKAFSVGKTVPVSLNNKKNKAVEKVTYFLGTAQIATGGTATLQFKNKKLGKHTLKAVVHSEGETFQVTKQITLLAATTPTLYTYTILETYPHDIKAYTQGLEFNNDTLYESTGQYKSSSLRKTDYKTGKILKKVNLKDKYFGEGLTILNNNIYQLTWKENIGLIYNLNTLQETGTFVYGESKQGWGLCNNGEKIFKSDGTERIWALNAATLAEEGFIQLYTNKSKIPKVNELEWVEGKIYANIYQQASIAIVNPNTGAVEGVINLTDLKDNVTQHDKLDVLNGIAYKGEPNILYVTGKNWDKTFKIKISPK